MSLLCNWDVLKQIYFAHFQSDISYGICGYGATAWYNLDNILRVQKKALRVLTNLEFSKSARVYFGELNIFTDYGLYTVYSLWNNNFLYK